MFTVRPIPPHTINRWTLEPILLFLPLLLMVFTTISAYTMLLALSGRGDVSTTSAVVVFAVLIVALSVLGLRKRR